MVVPVEQIPGGVMLDGGFAPEMAVDTPAIADIHVIKVVFFVVDDFWRPESVVTELEIQIQCAPVEPVTTVLGFCHTNSGAVAVGELWGYREIEELNENGAEFIIEKPMELLNLIDALNS
jgi:hypothetical protein